MKVELTDITKRFISLRGRVAALENVSLEIEEGEFFVLLGPSGCGKSTLLNLIAGLEKPSSGQIRFGNEVVADTDNHIYMSPKERNVAFVFQSYALYPHLNVFENIAFPLKIDRRKISEIKKAVEQTAATLEISNLLAARPAELSGGQRQRVAIARAIVRKPNLFLLDEPLSNLDAQLRIAMRSEIKDLQNRLGITTIYVTHDQTEAMALGDRIAVLNQGKIEQVGTSKTLYEGPESIFVAQFIGSPPMNLIKTFLTRADKKLYVVLGKQRIEIPTEKIQDFDKLKSDSFILGIRPEDVRINIKGDTQTIKAKVQSVEPLGRENIVHLFVENFVIIALYNKEDLRKGDEVNIQLQLGKAHIFNCDYV
jgi:multiple sugar transport system ATP-binding protein